MKVIADEMSDCWWMFGGGEIDYASWGSKVHCAICSVIKFDSKIPSISSNDFSDYLKVGNYSFSQTYSQYLYQSISVPSDIQISDIVSNEKYSIITGIDENLIGKDRFIRPYFIKSSELSKTGCKVFDITKA
jgi:hypothetical protein